MDDQEQKLKELLTEQDFRESENGNSEILAQRKSLAQSFAETGNGIAVLSDYQKDISYIYSGALGKKIGLESNSINESSAFEEIIFKHVPYEELIERHVLELRFFQLQKALPISERPYYCMLNSLHFKTANQETIPILHQSYYLESFPNGSIWLALCLYIPFVENNKQIIREIINNKTGETVLSDKYKQLDKQILSEREKEVISLLAKGQSSKQIADILNISVNTVYRHRQNILAALQVSNTAAAVEIAVRLNLIH